MVPDQSGNYILRMQKKRVLPFPVISLLLSFFLHFSFDPVIPHHQCLFRLGSYVVIKYKIGPETFIQYEGKIVDKRVGSEDKESYVELKDCLTLNPEGKIVAIEKMKRLTDSFIEAGVSWSMDIRTIILSNSNV